MNTPDPTSTKAPAPAPETTRHRIHEVPGQTKPVGKPAPKKKPAKGSGAKAGDKSFAKTKTAQAKAKKVAKIPRETKGSIVEAMLRRPEGATSADLEKATGWQAHSIRGFFAGTLKKKKGLEVTSEKVDGVRTYRLAAAAPAEAPEAV